MPDDNTYDDTGVGTEWSEGEPTAEDLLQLARRIAFHCHEAINSVVDSANYLDPWDLPTGSTIGGVDPLSGAQTFTVADVAAAAVKTILTREWDPASGTIVDNMALDDKWILPNDAGTPEAITYLRHMVTATDVSDGDEDVESEWLGMVGGSETSLFKLNASGAVLRSLSFFNASDVIALKAGSASLPSLTAEGDLNTGLFFPAADTIGLSTGGGEWVRIASNGFTGFNQAAPGTYIGETFGIAIGNLSLGAGGSSSIKLIAPTDGASAYDFTDTANTTNQGRMVYDHATDNWYLVVNASERLRVDASGNLLLGGTAMAASSVGNLHLFNGTAPSGSVANGVVLYAEDVSSSSELKVRDEAGNVSVLSPHNFSLCGGPSEELAWAYYSERDGKAINVDMLKLARAVERLTDEQLVYIQEVDKCPI